MKQFKSSAQEDSFSGSYCVNCQHISVLQCVGAYEPYF